MKKLLVAIFAFVYLASTIGATIYFHYCMGELVGTSIITPPMAKCSQCGMEKSHTGDNGCCHEKSKQIVGNNDQYIVTCQKSIQPFGLTAIIPARFFIPALPSFTIVKPIDYSPPHLKVPLNIIHSVFLI